MAVSTIPVATTTALLVDHQHLAAVRGHFKPLFALEKEATGRYASLLEATSESAVPESVHFF